MKRIGERIAKIEVADVPDKDGWPATIFLIGVVMLAAAAIAYVLYLQETTKPEPTGLEARSITPPLTVKEKGYIVDVGPVVVRRREPDTATSAVYISAKGPKPAHLNCVLLDPKGAPMGGGMVGAIDLAFGATMALNGPLLNEGKLRCSVVDRDAAKDKAAAEASLASH